MKNLFNVLDVCMKAGVTPLLIGESGIGKSQGVEQYCKKILNPRRKEAGQEELVYIPLAMGQMGPGDVQGVGHVRESAGGKFTEFCPGKVFDSGGKPIFLFLDEVNRTHPMVIQSLFELVLNGQITSSEFKLPEGSVIVLAGNPKSSKGGDYHIPSVLDDAFLGRVSIIPVEGDNDAYLNYIADKYDKDVARTVKLMGEHFAEFTYGAHEVVDNGQDAIGGYVIKPQRRKLDWALGLIEKCKDVISTFNTAKEDKDVRRAVELVLRGLVGEANMVCLLAGWSGEFVSFSELLDVIYINDTTGKREIDLTTLVRFYEGLYGDASKENRQKFALFNSTLNYLLSNQIDIKSPEGIHVMSILCWLYLERPEFVKAPTMVTTLQSAMIESGNDKLGDRFKTIADIKNKISAGIELTDKQNKILGKYEKSMKNIRKIYDKDRESFNTLKAKISDYVDMKADKEFMDSFDDEALEFIRQSDEKNKQ